MAKFEDIHNEEEFEAEVNNRVSEATKKYENYMSPEDVSNKYGSYLSPEEEEKKYKNYLSPEESAKKDAEIKGYKIKEIKNKIARENGLSYDAVDFLSGDDEESIKKSATALKSLVRNSKNQDPIFSLEK